MLPYILFVVLYMACLFISLIIGIIVFNGKSTYWEDVRPCFNDLPSKLKKNIKYLVILALMVVVIHLLTIFQPYYYHFFNTDYTPVFVNLEGYLLARLQQIENPILTHFFSLIYVFGLTFLLAFTPFLFIWRDDLKNGMKKYTAVMAFNYVVAIPFYIGVHLTAPSLYSSNIHPLLYWDHNYYDFVKFDGIHNSFPSLHVSFSFSILILVWLYKFENYTIFTAVIFVLTALSTIYLGIHYIIDIVAGIMVAVFAVAAVNLAETLLSKPRVRKRRRWLHIS